jgi:hypothetical protein
VTATTIENDIAGIKHDGKRFVVAATDIVVAAEAAF